jgi:hypothetical protein
LSVVQWPIGIETRWHKCQFSVSMAFRGLISHAEASPSRWTYMNLANSIEGHQFLYPNITILILGQQNFWTVAMILMSIFGNLCLDLIRFIPSEERWR